MTETSPIILETHIYSNPTNGSLPWSRSFHLRLHGPTATKPEILTLVRDSVTRLGRTDPVVDAQVILYFTRNGRVLSDAGTSSNLSSTTTISLPVYQPPQIITLSTPYTITQQLQGSPGWPLAMTYAGGVNYLQSYGPCPGSSLAVTTYGAQQQMMVVGGGTQLGLVNVNVNLPTVNFSGGRPVVSDVIREARLDGIVEDALEGLLDWAKGPMGLKLIVVVDIDGRDLT